MNRFEYKLCTVALKTLIIKIFIIKNDTIHSSSQQTRSN